MLDKLIHKTLNLPYRLHVSIDQGSRKAAKTVVMLHGIGAKGEMWRDVIDEIKAKDTRFVALDLLGFGQSPQPDWSNYRLNDNVRAIKRTLRHIHVVKPFVLIGHSLGSLVAIEYAKENPSHVSSIVLVSPPFYKKSDGRLKALTDKFYDYIYHFAFDKTQRKMVEKAAQLHQKVFAKEFEPNSVYTKAFRDTLMSSVLDYGVLDDAKALKQPMRILFGRYDPVVLKSHLNELVKENPNATLSTIASGHEIIGAMNKATVQTIKDVLANS